MAEATTYTTAVSEAMWRDVEREVQRERETSFVG